MTDEKKTPPPGATQPAGATQANEGEGNRTAARHYNEGVARTVNSGTVEKKAREAEKAVDGAERSELEAAEAIGKRHIAEEDPKLKKH